MTAPLAPAPGYYPDPLDSANERWWNGTGWTDAVRVATPSVRADVLPSDATVQSGGDVQSGAPDDSAVAECDSAELAQESDRDLVVPSLAPDIFPVRPRAASAKPAAPADAIPSVAPGIEVEGPATEPTTAPAPVEEPSAPAAVPAGFYPDPYGQAPLRWWDGAQWTVQTSQPEAAAGHPAASSPSATAAQPGVAAVSRSESQTTTAPLTRTPTTTVLPGAARGGSGPTFIGSSGRAGSRFPARSAAAALILLVGIGVRGYFWYDSPSDQQSAGASLAASVNLRQGDLPKGFVEQQDKAPSGSAGAPAPADRSEATVTAAQQEFDRAVNRCIGASDSATSVAFAAASPTFARVGTEVASDVTIVRNEALATQDLRAHQSAQAPGCVGKVGTKPLRTIMAGRGVTLTALSVTKLPGVPKDAFGLRTRMTMAANGRTMTVFSDTYGFVRRNVEVGLTVSRAGSAPDPAVAATALRQLQARTDAAVAKSGDVAG